ncbi:MAG: VCBS repeat-containing protein [Phycisphaerales bacterium]|nr:VCBS repeat-containing protein [Phycisphaerales bacterium]
MSKLIIAICTAAITTAALALDLTDDQRAELSKYFGFGPMQIYKLKMGLSQLRLADLNSDGRTDIALWNASRNRIEVLLQPDPNATTKPAANAAPSSERNDIPDRGPLTIDNVPLAARVAAMEIAELTGDKHADIVFFGEPRELAILPGKGDGTFGSPDGTRAPDGEPRPGCIAVGDFNSDGRADVALLGNEVIQIFGQKDGGGLGKPTRIVHNMKSPVLMLSADVNHDGRADILVGSDEDEYGVYVWLQEEAGNMGPLRRARVPKMRSISVAPRIGAKGDDIFAIESVGGRLKQYQWEVEPSAGGAEDWPQLSFGYPIRSQSKRRPIAIGDITGDGKTDVVAADPDAAQLILFEQGANGLRSGVAFPGLSKTLDICIADIDGDGKNELLSASAEEKTVGVSRFASGRLNFPTALAISGEPLALAAGALKTGGSSRQLAVVTREKGKATLGVVEAADQKSIQSFEIDELSDDPGGLRFFDVNQDGLNDLLLFVRFAPLRTYLQRTDGSFEAFKGPATREGLVKDAAIESSAFVDVTGDGKPEVIIAQKGLARALIVREGQWTVVDQYNPETSDAQIGGVAAICGEKAGSPTITLYDKKSREIVIMRRRDDGTYAVAQSMPVGAFELTAMTDAPLDGGKPALLLADAKTLLVLRPGQRPETLVEKHSYESTTKDAWLMDTVIGDINADGLRDVAVLDSRKANVELVTTMPDGSLERAMTFQVFQGKRFRDDPDTRGEPREAQIGDVTGDNRPDLVVIVHDRVIVYPGQ